MATENYKWHGMKKLAVLALMVPAGAGAGQAARDFFRRDGFTVRSVREEGFSTQRQSKCRGDCEVVLGENMDDEPGHGPIGVCAGRLE